MLGSKTTKLNPTPLPPPRRRARAPRLPPRRGRGAAAVAEREAVNLLPGQRRIFADPKPGRARAEIENVVVVRINGQTLSNAPPIFIATHPEGHLHRLKSLALVHRTQDGRRRGLMHPRGDIDALRVNRIGGDALRAHEIVVEAQSVRGTHTFAWLSHL